MAQQLRRQREAAEKAARLNNLFSGTRPAAPGPHAGQPPEGRQNGATAVMQLPTPPVTAPNRPPEGQAPPQHPTSPPARAPVARSRNRPPQAQEGPLRPALPPIRVPAIRPRQADSPGPQAAAGVLTY